MSITPQQLLRAIEEQCDTENVTENAISVIGPLDVEAMALALNTTYST